LIFEDEAQKNVELIRQNILDINKVWDGYMSTYLTEDEKKLADKFAIDRKRFVVEGLNPAVEYLVAGNTDGVEK
jgi:hypothetical protein